MSPRKLCPFPSGLSQVVSCEVAAVHQRHCEVTLDRCRCALLSLQSTIPVKVIHVWWRSHFRELDTSSESKELLPTCVHSCSLRANKVPNIAEIHGKYITPDDTLESVEETTLSSCRAPSLLVDSLHVQCSCRQNGI